jgi:uncharacterized membrane-anchored protein
MTSALSKVPEVTLVFWVIKILATTLGETGGDALSMSLKLGYLLSTGLLAAIFVVFVVAQSRAEQFKPPLYWATIVATTTLGTTLADFVDRSLHIGYAGGSSLLTALGDWTADTAGFGYLGSALIFGALLLVVWAAHGSRRIDSAVVFWSAFVLTRPLGAVVGDFLDKPLAKGGLAMGRFPASLTLLVMIVALIALTKQRPAREAH